MYDVLQFYISCAQVTVTGGSGGTPSPTAKIPGHVKATDPGYTVNVSQRYEHVSGDMDSSSSDTL